MAISFREQEEFTCNTCFSKLKKVKQQITNDVFAEYYKCPHCNYMFKRTGLQVLPFRQWHRKIAGPGSEPNFKDTGKRGGIVLEDIDGFNLIWCYHWTPRTKFRLWEYKFGNAPLSSSQQINLPILDEFCWSGHSKTAEYTGFYKVNSPHLDWYKATYMMVNDKKYSMEDFIKWIRWDLEIPPLW